MVEHEQDISLDEYTKRLDICDACDQMQQTDEGTICKDKNIVIGFVAGISVCSCPKGKW